MPNSREMELVTKEPAAVTERVKKRPFSEKMMSVVLAPMSRMTTGSVSSG